MKINHISEAGVSFEIQFGLWNKVVPYTFLIVPFHYHKPVRRFLSIKSLEHSQI